MERVINITSHFIVLACENASFCLTSNLNIRFMNLTLFRLKLGMILKSQFLKAGYENTAAHFLWIIFWNRLKPVKVIGYNFQLK